MSSVQPNNVFKKDFKMFVKSRSNWYGLDWSGAELYRYCCQWMEKASSCLCSHRL